jgi:hypothetical protein
MKHLYEFALPIQEWIHITFKSVPTDKSFQDILQTSNGILSIALFLLGMFYSFFGMKFKNFSFSSLMSIAMYTFLKNYSSTLDFFALSIKKFILSGVTETIKAHVPKSLAYLFDSTSDRNCELGYVVMSIIVSVVLIYLIPLCKIVGFGLLLFFTQQTFCDIFKNETEFKYAYLVASFFAVFLVIELYEIASYVIFMIALSFIGSSITLTGLSTLFKYPSNFERLYTEIQQSGVDAIFSVNFVYFSLLFCFCLIFQNSLNKNKLN